MRGDGSFFEQVKLGQRTIGRLCRKSDGTRIDRVDDIKSAFPFIDYITGNRQMEWRLRTRNENDEFVIGCGCTMPIQEQRVHITTGIYTSPEIDSRVDVFCRRTKLSYVGRVAHR